MNNTLTRAITGGVFIATLIFCAVFSGLTLSILFLFFTVVGTYEYLNIVSQSKKNNPNQILAYTLSFLSYFLLVNNADSSLLYLIIFPLIFSLFLFELFRSKENGFENILHSLMPSIYIAIPFALLVNGGKLLHANGEYTPSFVLLFFYTLWSNDTGAFIAGKAFGKHKLFERISPKKTWEGFIGGAILALVAAYISSIFFKELKAIEWMLMALLIVIFGTLGDLVESMLKRNFNVKDSGKILPGHGGILDRFDGLLLASPMVYALIVLLKEYHFYFNPA